MCFTPREAWESVKILAGGMTIHHEKPTVMRLRLTNFELATNDAENASVMGSHLEKVYRNQRPVDWLALQGLLQRTSMLKPDNLISWEEVKLAVTKLSNGNHQDLTTYLPTHSKHSTIKIYSPCWNFLTRTRKKKQISTNGTKANLCQSPRAEI